MEEAVEDRTDNRDRGYAWVVLLCSFFLAAMTSGSYVSYGVFFPEYVEHFQKTKAEVGVVSSLGTGSAGIVGIFLGPLAKRFGYRAVSLCGVLCPIGLIISSLSPNLYMLYLTHGILNGIGVGCYNMGFVLAVIDHFNKRRSMALGIQAFGFSVGVLTVPQFLRFVIDKYAWRGALLLFGGFHLHSLILGSLFRPLDVKIKCNPKAKEMVDMPSHKSTIEDTEYSDLQNTSNSLLAETNKARTENTKKQNDNKFECTCSIKTFLDYTILKDAKAVLFYFAVAFIVSAHFIPYLLLPARAMSYGEDKQKSTFLLSLMGICSGISRPLFGLLGDAIKSHRALVVTFAAFIVGLIQIISYFFRNYIVLAVMFGFAASMSSGYISLNAAVMADIVEPSKMEHGTGLLLCFLGIANMATTPFAGFLVDKTKNYATPFLILGSIQILGGFLNLIVYILQRREARKKNKREEVTMEIKT